MPGRYYERLTEEGRLKRAPLCDYDGSVVGAIVYNVPAWLDENPGEAHRLGWTKHVTHDRKELRELYDWCPQTQYLERSVRRVDEWTVEDVYHVRDKSEEMMLREELATAVTYGDELVFDDDVTWEV